MIRLLRIPICSCLLHSNVSIIFHCRLYIDWINYMPWVEKNHPLLCHFSFLYSFHCGVDALYPVWITLMTRKHICRLHTVSFLYNCYDIKSCHAFLVFPSLHYYQWILRIDKSESHVPFQRILHQSVLFNWLVLTDMVLRQCLKQ